MVNKQIDRRLKIGLYSMYLDTLVMAIGFYMLVPLLSVYAIDQLGWSTALVGVILAISSLSQNGFRFLAGLLADKIGYKKAILLGVGIRILGYLTFGLFQIPAGFMVAAFISGIGGSLFHPASYAIYAVLTEKKGRSRIYAIREMLSNLGFILGPVIGMYLLKIDFTIVCFTSAGMFIAAWILTYFFIPFVGHSKDQKSNFIKQVFAKMIKDKSFIKFNIVVMVIWSLSVQLYLIVPIRASQIDLDTSVLAYLYTVAAVFMVILQLPVNLWVGKRFKPWIVLGLGSFFIALGILVIGFSTALPMLLVGILVFTMGQMLFVPKMNEMTSGFADNQLFASYFGFSGFFLAVGGFLGNSLSGSFHAYTSQQESLRWMPWVFSALIGIAITLLIVLKKAIRGAEHQNEWTKTIEKGR